MNALSHYTDWTVGHVHSGALGWVGFITIGSIYYLMPRLLGRKMYSIKSIEAHFWIAHHRYRAVYRFYVDCRRDAGPDVGALEPLTAR